MKRIRWQGLTLIERIRWLRYVLPPVLVVVVTSYQLGVAQWLSEQYGHTVHYGFEIAFYSFTGPIATWLTLTWVERRLREKEALEREVQARRQQLASLTEASADAILSLDQTGHIVSWNRGAERMLGYGADSALGAGLDLFLVDASELATLLASRHVIQNYDAEARTRDGRTLRVNVTQTRLQRNGNSASLLIMRDVTARRERETIIEEERARIARDLHDGVAQTLYFAALQADLGRQQLGQEPQRVSDTLGEIGVKIREVIRDVRRTIFALRPLNWSEGEFLDALNRFADGFAEQMGWQLHVALDERIGSIPARLQLTLYRVVQESFNNIAKHAAASTVWLRLELEAEGSIQLTIRDDGVGFDPQKIDSGLGLEQMRARVRRSGGRLTIESAPGQGASICVTLPGQRNDHG